MKVLLVWELGGQWGHFGTLMPIADALTEEGHEIVFVLKDLSRAHPLIGLRYPYFQAPISRDAKQASRRYESFADILLHAGFDHADALGGLVSAWRSLYAQLQPDWVIYDHAPTALFAARGLPFKKTYVGTGFSMPPHGEHFPRFRYWQTDTANEHAHRQDSHQRAIENANRAAKQLKIPVINSLPEIFSEAAQKLTTFAVLDHYPNRTTADYIGPIGGLGKGEPFEKRSGERWIFCYLWARHPGTLNLLKALADISDFKTLAVVPDLPEPAPAKQQYKNLSVTRQPIDLSNLSLWAELIVCNAGHGTLALALSQGLPSINRPVTLEHIMLTKRVEEAHAGITQQSRDASEAAIQIAHAFRQQADKAGAVTIQKTHQGSIAKTNEELRIALMN